MKTLFKRVTLLSCLAAVIAVAGVGCNTAHGFGKDVEKAGEGIQSGTK
jgi:predicted small secreted protein